MHLKFCTPDRFIIKDFTLMNSDIDHIHYYAQKYRHFLSSNITGVTKGKNNTYYFLTRKKVRQKSMKVYFEFFLPTYSRV